MGYCSSSDVGALSPHLISGAGDFTTSTSPTLVQVNQWISAGSSIINTRLAAKGYGAIPTTSMAYDFARDINANYGAYRAELSRLSSRVSRDENTRADFFKKAYMDMLNDVVVLDLSNAGVPRDYAPPANFAGGISVSDKQENDSDPDIVQPRFQRGQFQNAETINPVPTGNARQGGGDEDLVAEG